MIRGFYGRLFNYGLILVLGVSLCGCAAFFIGSAVGVVGGYAISKDTIQGETEKDADSLIDAAKEVLEEMEAENIDEYAGRIKARVGKSRVTITIEQLTPKTSRLRVKARKYFLPDLQLSQKLYLRIIEYAE